MNMAKLTDVQRLDYEKRLKLRHGELVDIAYDDLESQVDPESGALVEVPVQRVAQHYIGRMSARQTSGIISILGALFVNGTTAKELTGRKDNLAFVEYLDEYHLTLLAAVVLEEDQAWVTANWDLTWVMRVLRIFFKKDYNDFFAMLGELKNLAQDLGVKESQARAVALGQTVN